MTDHAKAKLTWLGHGSFLLTSPAGKNLLLDPWVMGNPACPESARNPEHIDCVLITHGHSDHMGDILEIAKRYHPAIVANFEISQWLGSKGISKVVGVNKGGTWTYDAIRITMTDARHSSSIADQGKLLYGGEASGYVLRMENGFTLYFSGDTGIFGDMRLIGEIYRPSVACLSIGDHFTMGPEEAAYACRLLGVKKVVPMHYRTFPLLTGKPEDLAVLLAGQGVDVVRLQPGETAEF